MEPEGSMSCSQEPISIPGSNVYKLVITNKAMMCDSDIKKFKVDRIIT